MLKKLKEIRMSFLTSLEKSGMAYDDINEGILVDAYYFECVLHSVYNISFKYYYRKGVKQKHLIDISLSSGYTQYMHSNGQVNISSHEEAAAFAPIFIQSCKQIIEAIMVINTIQKNNGLSIQDMRKYTIDTLITTGI